MDNTKEIYDLAKLKVKAIRRALKEGSEIEKELSLDDWLLVRGIDKKLYEALEEAIDLCILTKQEVKENE